jgi:hypothetical protein
MHRAIASPAAEAFRTVRVLLEASQQPRHAMRFVETVATCAFARLAEQAEEVPARAPREGRHDLRSDSPAAGDAPIARSAVGFRKPITLRQETGAAVVGCEDVTTRFWSRFD